MVGYVVIGAAIVVTVGVLFIATVPIAGSRVWRRFWVVAFLLAVGTLSVFVASAPTAPEQLRPTSEPSFDATDCDDLIAGDPPLVPTASDSVWIGRGDTFFMGVRGRRWSENLSWYGDAFHMKVGVYTLDTRRPTMSVERIDGAVSGTAEFSRNELEAHPGPVPVLITFPTEGCWKVEATGTNGLASIEVRVGASTDGVERS